jgi:predicted ATPase/class 3 adenylate cyclase
MWSAPHRFVEPHASAGLRWHDAFVSAVGAPPPERMLPSGIVTFVFTDIAGSTRLFQTLGDRYVEILRRHNVLLRRAFEGRGGVEIKNEGDSLFFAFDDPTGAVVACIEGQRALTSEQWIHGEPVLVRMGVHTGEATPIEGDYIALPVHQAARIAASAHGGQVVLSATTREAAAHPSGTTATDLGLHLLKDFDEPQRLWQLSSDELPQHFPPLRTRTVSLPTPRTTFVGRARELDALVARLHAPGLVTVTGPGGVGKTRLTVEAAGALGAVDVAGVHLIELSNEDDPQAVAGLLARQLGITTRPDRPLVEAVAAEIGVRRAVLVLDNCERAIDACGAVVAALLASCPNVTIVATSRTPLEVEGESVLRVDPLPVEDDDRPADALRLLLDRVAAATGSDAFRPDELTAATEICRRLDGLPLALELAGATAARVPLVTLVNELDDRLDVLRARGRPERQQTLRNLLDWSHELVSDHARRAFRRLAVLPGSFGVLVAARIACAFEDIRERELHRAIAELVDHSLVSVDVSTGRYSLLETVRVYAREQLDACDERPATEAALVEWASTWLWALDFDGSAVPDVVRAVSAEYPTLVAALELAWASDHERFLVLCGALGRYWHSRGMLRDGLTWCDRALSSSTLPSPARAEVELRKARLELELGNFRHVLDALFDPASSLMRAGDTRQRLEARLYQASALEQLADLDQSESLGEALLADARAIGDARIVARTLNHLGIVAFQRGDFDLARRRYLDALTVAVEEALAREVAVLHVNLGEACLKLRDIESARRHLIAAAELAGRNDQVVIHIAALELLTTTEPAPARREALREELARLGATIGPEVLSTIERQMSIDDDRTPRDRDET